MPMQATTTAPLFAATLRPDRSMRMAGGWIALCLAAIVGTPFLIAVPEFVVPGLVGFSGAVSALVALGLRQARRVRVIEQVTLWPDQLEICVTGPGNGRNLRRFEPSAVRLVLERDENERTTGLFLRNGDERLEIGAFLKSDDRSSFAKAFGSALRRARQSA